MKPEGAPLGGEPSAPRPGDSAELGVQIASAWRGLVDLLAAKPDWPRNFDLSARGFVRSFLGPLLALPLHMFGFGLVERVMRNGRPPPGSHFGWVALAHVIDMFAFPLLIALIARPLRIGGGYTAFIIVLNWAALFVNLAFAAAAPMALIGEGGLDLFRLVYMILLCFSVFLVWRSGRVMLSREAAPVLLVVVLSVAVGAAADQLAAVVVSVA